MEETHLTESRHLANQARVPQREFRLLVEGMHRWLSELAGERSEPAPCVGFVRGEAGRGGRQALHALRGMCEQLGMEVLHVRGRDGSGPSAWIGSLVDQLLRSVRLPGEEENAGPNSRIEVAPDILAVLASVTPGAGSIDGVAPAPDLGPAANVHRLADAVSQTLRAIARSRPVLAVFERIDLAGSIAAEVAQHLVRVLTKANSARPERVLVVASAADGNDPSLSSLVEVADRTVFEVEMRGCSRDDLQELARVLVGAELSVSERERVLRATRGRIRHVTWLLRLAGDSAAGVRGWDRWLGLSFSALVRLRAERLGALERAVVNALAAAGCALPEAAIIDSLRVTADSADDDAPAAAAIRAAIAEAREAGWVSSSPDGRDSSGIAYSICDAEVAEIVLRDLSSAARCEVFASLVAALERASSGDERWLPLLSRLAIEDLERIDNPGVITRGFDYLERVGCADEVLELLPAGIELLAARAPADADPWRARYAGLLERTGRLHESREESERLTGEEVDRTIAVEAWRRIGDIARAEGQTVDAVNCYRRGLERLDEVDRALRIHLLRRLAEACAALGDRDAALRALAIATDGIGAADREDELRLTQLTLELSPPGKNAGSIPARTTTWSLGLRDLCAGVRICLKIARLCRERAELGAAEEWLDAADEIAAASGSRELVAEVLSVRGELALERGESELALRLLRAARETLEEFGAGAALRELYGSILEVELASGTFDAAGRTARRLAESWAEEAPADDRPFRLRPEGRERPQRIAALEKTVYGEAPSSIHDHLELLVAALDSGQLTEATEHGGALVRSARRDDADECAVVTMAGALLARIEALRGEYDGALRWVAEALKGQRGVPDRRVVQAAFSVAGRVSLERGELARAYHYFLRELRLARELGSADRLGLAYIDLADFLIEGGALAAAEEIARGAIQLAALAGDSRVELPARRILARRAALAGETDVAHAELTRAERLVARLELPVDACFLRLERGWLEVGRGDFERALVVAREGIEIARSKGLHPLLDDFLHLLGAIEGARGNARSNFLRALEALEQAVAGAEARCRPQRSWEALIAIAKAYAERGKLELTRQYEARAREVESIALHPLPAELASLSWQSRVPLQASPVAV